MKASKAITLLLIGQFWLSGIMCGHLMAQSGSLTLAGQVSLNSVGQGSRLTALLYYPKEMGRKPLLAYVDGDGKFEFGNLPSGSFLIEVYADGNLIYQKSISLNSSFRIEDRLVQLGIKSADRGWSKVASIPLLKQRHKVTLAGSEFQRRVTVYVGDIHGSDSFALVVFKTGNESSRWLDSKRIEESTLRGAVGRDQILSDAKVGGSNLKTSFTSDGRYYSLDITKIKNVVIGDDYLSFEIWRKN